MWDLPGPGFEPMSLALAGRFLTTEPPGESQEIIFESGSDDRMRIMPQECYFGSKLQGRLESSQGRLEGRLLLSKKWEDYKKMRSRERAGETGE